MSLGAAQALGLAGPPTPPAVSVAGVAFPVLVCVPARRARPDRAHTAAQSIQPVILPAAGAGVGVGPSTAGTGLVTFWGRSQPVGHKHQLRSRPSRALLPAHSPVKESRYWCEGQDPAHPPLVRVACGCTQAAQSWLLGPVHTEQSGWHRKHSAGSVLWKNLSGQPGTHRPSWRTWCSSQSALINAHTHTHTL